MEKLFFFNRDFLSAGSVCPQGLYVCFCHGAEHNVQENGNAHGSLSQFYAVSLTDKLILSNRRLSLKQPWLPGDEYCLRSQAIVGMIENKSRDFWQRKHCQRLQAIFFLEQMVLILLFCCGQTDSYLLSLLASSTVNAKFSNSCLFCSLSKCSWTVRGINEVSGYPVGPLLTNGTILKTHLISKIVGLILFLFIHKRHSRVPSYGEEIGKSVIHDSFGITYQKVVIIVFIWCFKEENIVPYPLQYIWVSANISIFFNTVNLPLNSAKLE